MLTRDPDSMPPDLLDSAFIARLPAAAPPPEPSPSLQRETTTKASLEHAPVSTSEPKPDPPSGPTPEPARGADGVVDRLLSRATHAWNTIAEAVEEGSAESGEGKPFVLAVVGKRAGDGCTTFVEALARVLRLRGYEVGTTEVDRPDGPRAIRLIDAGVWFGTGPIQRERAAQLAASCDAAILLRRADRASAAAFARAIGVAGVRVLGEVTTFGCGHAADDAPREAAA